MISDEQLEIFIDKIRKKYDIHFVSLKNDDGITTFYDYIIEFDESKYFIEAYSLKSYTHYIDLLNWFDNWLKLVEPEFYLRKQRLNKLKSLI